MKRLVKRLLFTTLISTVCFPVFCLQNFTVSPLQATQVVQLGITALKTVAGIWADSIEPCDADAAKLRSCVQLMYLGLQGATKGLGWYNGERDAASLVAHLNASVWQAVSQIKEIKAIAELQKEYAACEFDDFDLEDESFFQKNLLKSVLRITEFCLSAGMIWRLGSQKQQQLMMMGQATSDLLLRFAFSDIRSALPGWIEKAEPISSIVASGYDIGKSIYHIAKGEPEEAEDLLVQAVLVEYECPSCHGNYPAVQFGQMMECRHQCCMPCVARRQKVRVGAGYDNGDAQGLRQVAQIDGERLEIAGTVDCQCPICDRGGQKFLAQNIVNARAGVAPKPKPRESQKLICPVCQEELPPANRRQALPCMHLYCKDCLKNALDHNMARCYVCLKKFGDEIGCTKEDLRQMLELP